MTDEQFDDLAREALAYDAALPNEAVWNRVRPVRSVWLPTVREILVCGSVCALALLVMRARIGRGPAATAGQNPVIQAAMHDETRFVLSSITQMPGSPSPTVLR